MLKCKVTFSNWHLQFISFLLCHMYITIKHDNVTCKQLLICILNSLFVAQNKPIGLKLTNMYKTYIQLHFIMFCDPKWTRNSRMPSIWLPVIIVMSYMSYDIRMCMKCYMTIFYACITSLKGWFHPIKQHSSLPSHPKVVESKIIPWKCCFEHVPEFSQFWKMFTFQ